MTRRTAVRKHNAKVAARTKSPSKTPNRITTTTIHAPAAPPKDWFDEMCASSKASKRLEAVLVGNQIIFRLSAGPTAGNSEPYFLVQDPKSQWWYLVWDVNTPGGPFHGKYQKGQA